MSTGRLAGKIAIVTGAARGLGAAIAKRYAKEGATVVVADIKEELGRQICAEIGGSASFRGVDVGDCDQVRALIDGVVADHGRLDILVNNAAINRGGLITKMPLEIWDRVIHTNLTSVFYACRAALPHMEAQGNGAIINISSIGGIAGDRHAAAYNAAKAGVLNLTRSLGVEYIAQNIRINAICPGSFVTDMNPGMAYPFVVEPWLKWIPAGRFGQPDELTGVAVLLASDDASFIAGAAFVVDGGINAGGGAPNWTELSDQVRALRAAGSAEPAITKAGGRPAAGEETP